MKSSFSFGWRFAASLLLTATIVFTGLPVSVSAQSESGSTDLDMVLKNGIGKMPAENFEAFKTAAAKSGSTAEAAKRAGGATTKYYFISIEFKSAAARQAYFTDLKKSNLAGTSVVTVQDQFADIFISDSQEGNVAYGKLKKDQTILKVEVVTGVDAPPPPQATQSTKISQAVPENIVRGGYKGLTGKNVIVAIIDTGIDFRHPDFITYDAQGKPTSRLLALWDTGTPYQTGRGSLSPVKFPNGGSIGTLYTKDQLTAELRSPRVTIPATDMIGHGTACAGIAAGNGNGDKRTGGLKRPEVVGVAPEADIIGIRLGAIGLSNTFLLNAMCEWLDKFAGTKPLVISGSFGGHWTGHDGQGIRERHLNARFPVSKPGRSILFAAGNEGNDPMHAKATVSATPKEIRWNVGGDSVITMYFDTNERLSWQAPATTPLKDRLEYKLDPITNQWQITLLVAKGPGSISFTTDSKRPVNAHFYIPSGNGAFAPDVMSYTHLVGSPGDMENSITVGSYDWNDNFIFGTGKGFLESTCSGSDGKPLAIQIGWLSCYSSPGPTRNGAVKPDIVAPGEWYSASYAKVPGGGSLAQQWDVDATGNYAAMNGTSSATPYTAGIVALMFSKKPTLTLGEIKNLLKGKTTKSGVNPFREAIPNGSWGYGKLDIAAIDRIFASF